MFSLFRKAGKKREKWKNNGNGRVKRIEDVITKPDLLIIEKDRVGINGLYAITAYIDLYPEKIYEGWVANKLTWKPYMLDFCQFIKPKDEVKIVEELNRKITKLEAKLAELKEKGRIDTQSIEKELEDYYRYRDRLITRNTRLFEVATYFRVVGEKDRVADYFNDLEKQLRGEGAFPRRVMYLTLQGLKCFLPENRDWLKRTALADSDAVASCFPFATPLHIQESGVVYGFDVLTAYPVIVDRFRLQGHNEVIIGSIGSGKSFFTKLEVLRWKLRDKDLSVYIGDPLKGYSELVDVLNAQEVSVGKSIINPLDIFVTPGSTIKDVLKEKLISVLEFFNTFFEDEIGNPLDKAESGVLRKAIVNSYEDKSNPTISDVIERIPDVAAGDEEKKAAERLESAFQSFKAELSMFNGQTEVDVNKKVVYFDFSKVESVSKSPLVMHAVLNWISSRVRVEKGRKLVVFDEAHYFMGESKNIRRFLAREIRHSRHYKTGYALISQSFEDFTNTEEGRIILGNSNVIVVFRLDSIPEDARKMLKISKSGEEFVREAAAGNVAGYSSALLILPAVGSFHINVYASDTERMYLS